MSHAYLCDKKGNDFFEQPIVVLKTCVENYFRLVLPQSAFDFFILIFEHFFQNTNNGENAIQNQFNFFDKEYTKIQPIINELLDAQAYEENENIAQYIKYLNPLVNIKAPIIFYGHSGKKKTFLIRLLANLYARSKSNLFILVLFIFMRF